MKKNYFDNGDDDWGYDDDRNTILVPEFVIGLIWIASFILMMYLTTRLGATILMALGISIVLTAILFVLALAGSIIDTKFIKFTQSRVH